MYMVVGAAFYLVPDMVRTMLFMAPFSGHEEGYMRLLGVAVAIIGWFYVFGARTRAESFALATVADRIAVPVLLLPLYFTGQMPAGPIIAFALLDPLLALGEAEPVEEGVGAAQRQRRDLVDVAVPHRHRQRRRVEASTAAGLTGHEAHVLLVRLPGAFAVGVVVAAAQEGHQAFV